MKLFQTILLVIFSACFVFAQNINLDLQSFYDFNNDTPNNIIDQGEAAQDGTPNALINDSGLMGNSYLFNGSTSKIDCDNDNRNITDEFSLCAWIKTDNSSRQIFLSKYNWTADKGYFLAILNGDATIGGRVGNGTFYETQNTAFVSDGEWHYVVGTFENSTFCIYVDCEKVGSIDVDTNNPQFTNPLPLSIGYTFEANGSGDNRYFDGNIDEVRIYNRVLTSSEIEFLCQETFPEEICDNEIDDDADGLTDCDDPDLMFDPCCNINLTEICDNGIDDDGDGLIDCDDPDLADELCCLLIEICDNGIDDDEDGFIDCDDPDLVNDCCCIGCSSCQSTFGSFTSQTFNFLKISNDEFVLTTTENNNTSLPKTYNSEEIKVEVRSLEMKKLLKSHYSTTSKSKQSIGLETERILQIKVKERMDELHKLKNNRRLIISVRL